MIPQPIDQVPLFQRLDQDERELVIARLRRRQVTAGEVIFNAGRPSDAFFVVVAGWVKLEDAASERTTTLANLGAGSLLGEVDTLLGRPYSTSARAAANTQLLALSRGDVEDLISQHPGIGLKFSATLGMRTAFLEKYLVQQRLRNIDLLSSLSEEDLRAIAQRLDFKSFSHGDVIVEAGAPGESVFFIEEGQIRLISQSSEGESFEELEEGGLFGHTALITGKPYPATAYAVTDVSVWFISRAVYPDLIREHPAIKLAFSRALAETLGPTDQLEAVERIRRLSLFTDVPTEALTALVGRLVLRHFPAGEVIYSEGTPGDALYVVESGEVKLLDSGFSDAQLLERMRAGDSFGEMALLTGRTRAECARAASDTTLWVLYKSDFDDLMVLYPEISVSLSRALSERLAARENDFVVRHLRRISLFSSLATSELRAISRQVRGLRFRPGEIICFAGQPAQTLFMIEMGEVKRFGVGPVGEPVLIDLLGPGDSFGEQAIVQNSAYNASAQAIGEVELWTIAKADFDAMLEKYPTLAITVTRLMADRLARTQPLPTGSAGGMPRAPRAAPPGTGILRGPAAPPQRGPAARPGGVLPPSRIQRPLSGARPVQRPGAQKPAPKATDEAPTVIMPRARPRQQGPTGSQTAAMPRSQVRAAADNAPTVVMPRPQTRGTGPDGPATVVLPRVPGAKGYGQTAIPVAPRRAPRKQAIPGPVLRLPGKAFFNELVTWAAGLSLGAKLRVTALTGLVVWFGLIALPATAITTISSAIAGMQTSGSSQSGAASSDKSATAEPTTGKALKIAAAAATDTPTPTRTRVPPTATRPRPTSVPVTRAPTQPPPTAAPAAPAAPTAPPLPPAFWDERLGSGPKALPRLESVRLVKANVSSGQKFWRAVSVKFEDVNESGNDHTIYVKVVDENGKRVDGKKAHMTTDGGLSEYPEEKPAGDMCNCNFNYPMFGDGYGFTIEDQFPSDSVAGMRMPLNRHVNYRVTFQLTTMP